MQIAPADLAFVVSMLDRARYYNDRPNAHGTRRLIIDVRSGVRNAHRLGVICGDLVPHPSGGRLRIRIRGTAAEALLAEALPHMSTRERARAVAALARVARTPICPSVAKGPSPSPGTAS
jgi:hypothetical protein